MQTVTIRELRQNWPKIEARLRAARQPLLVTRDGAPVAQMSPPPAVAGTATTFDANAHGRWLRRIWGTRRPGTDSAAWLARERAERIS
jgi:antitoxin (DNA-binding transcriptional repressor) of toxin-antitoxin stability system